MAASKKSLEERAEEYAESYINGNITWVMEQLAKTRKRASLVLLIYHQLYASSGGLRGVETSYASSFTRCVTERGL